MKTIGILGGMSAASTALYYDRLNAEVARRFGGLHSADVLIRSVDFATIEEMQATGDWDGAGAYLADLAVKLEAGGAEVLILATNTMHKIAPAIRDAVSIPFLHIADATAEVIRAAGKKRPALMATAYTMEQDFYTGRLREFGLDPVTPDIKDRAETHRVIYEELCKGVVRKISRQEYEGIAARLVAKKADCLILGCTEVGMLLNTRNVTVPVFDTTLIHCDAALDLALGISRE